MDVALARRLLRDYQSKKNTTVSEILDELEWYLSDGRPLFDAARIKARADLVVNGDLSTNEIVDTITGKLRDWQSS
jgi:hypothetical protein